MTIDEAIAHARKKAKDKKTKYDKCPTRMRYRCEMCFHEPKCNEVAKEHKQFAEWLEELKELREYKKKMELQYLDDIDNPLEPLKLQYALQSEIFKYNYRKEHKPQDINMLDYTVMYALKHCLEEQLKAGVENERY